MRTCAGACSDSVITSTGLGLLLLEFRAPYFGVQSSFFWSSGFLILEFRVPYARVWSLAPWGLRRLRLRVQGLAVWVSVFPTWRWLMEKSFCVHRPVNGLFRRNPGV